MPIAFGTLSPELNVSASAATTTNAFGTSVGKLQVSGTGLTSAVTFGTAKVNAFTITCSAIVETDAVGNSMVVAKDWSVVVAPSSTDFSQVTAASSTDFTQVENEGSL